MFQGYAADILITFDRRHLATLGGWTAGPAVAELLLACCDSMLTTLG